MIEGAVGPDRGGMTQRAMFGVSRRPMSVLVLLLVTGLAVGPVRSLEKGLVVPRRMAIGTGRIRVGAQEFKPAGEGSVVVGRVTPRRGRIAQVTTGQDQDQDEEAALPDPPGGVLQTKGPYLLHGNLVPW